MMKHKSGVISTSEFWQESKESYTAEFWQAIASKQSNQLIQNKEETLYPNQPVVYHHEQTIKEKTNMRTMHEKRIIGDISGKHLNKSKEETVDSKINDLDLKATVAKESNQERLLSPLSNNPVVMRHINLIRKRKTNNRALMVSLAEQMFVLSLYLEKETIVVENCKFGVKLTVGMEDLGVQIFTKGTDAERIDWKDLIGELVESRTLHSVKSSLQVRRQRRKRNDDCIIGGYNVSATGTLLRNSVPNKYIPLIPTAKFLVDEELTKQEEALKSELEYLKELDGLAPEWEGSKSEEFINVNS